MLGIDLSLSLSSYFLEYSVKKLKYMNFLALIMKNYYIIFLINVNYVFSYYGRRGNDSSSELSISDDDDKDKSTNNIKPP